MNPDIRNRVDRLARAVLELADGNELVIFRSDEDFDSVSALQFILALEKEFDIVVEDEDVCAGNLSSLDAVARFVEAKLGV